MIWPQGAYFAHIVKVKFAHPHLLIILTKHACHHNSFWRSRCDSNHAPTISLKLVHFHGDFGISFRLMTQVLSRHTSSLTSDHPHDISSYFDHIFYKIFTFRPIPAKTNLSRLATQNILKTNQNVQMYSTTLTMIHKESSFSVKLRSYVTSLIGWTNKRINKRFTFASLSHPKFVNKLKVALLFFSSN